MPIVFLACALLVGTTTVLHYEALRTLNTRLPSLGIPSRTKLLVVMIVAFFAHAFEIALYGGALHVLVADLHAGSLLGAHGFSFANCIYLSAETYTSLGFGDITPTGPVRLLAGVEALNGLLLIGWTASFTYIAMARFWTTPAARRSRRSARRRSQPGAAGGVRERRDEAEVLH
ncbi:ion transporter [Azoarcus sp. DN11]|nr:ion transporter [Azoarcus sp. DN11]